MSRNNNIVAVYPVKTERNYEEGEPTPVAPVQETLDQKEGLPH